MTPQKLAALRDYWAAQVVSQARLAQTTSWPTLDKAIQALNDAYASFKKYKALAP